MSRDKPARGQLQQNNGSMAECEGPENIPTQPNGEGVIGNPMGEGISKTNFFQELEFPD